MAILMSLILLQATAGAPQATAPAEIAPPDDAKIVCRTVNGTGSRLGGKRVCLPKKEWRRLAQESEETARYYQDRQSKQPGNQ